MNTSVGLLTHFTPKLFWVKIKNEFNKFCGTDNGYMNEQMRIFLSPPHMGGEELRFVREAFETNYIAPLGPMVDAFEREFAEKIGIPHAVALSSGTAAMHLALRILGV